MICMFSEEESKVKRIILIILVILIFLVAAVGISYALPNNAFLSSDVKFVTPSITLSYDSNDYIKSGEEFSFSVSKSISDVPYKIYLNTSKDCSDSNIKLYNDSYLLYDGKISALDYDNSYLLYKDLSGKNYNNYKLFVTSFNAENKCSFSLNIEMGL